MVLPERVSYFSSSNIQYIPLCDTIVVTLRLYHVIKTPISMKKNIIVLVTALITLVGSLATQELQAQTKEDKQAITETALNYLEGWYSGDEARMEKALAKDLKKRGFLIHPQTGELRIAEATYDQMINWTTKKDNEMEKDPNIKLEVKIIEIGDNVAMVKTISPKFTDYIHMGKKDGEWKIYNVIWEP